MDAKPPWLQLRLIIRTPPALHRCEPHWTWAPPPLPDHDLWCVLGGSGWLSIGARRHELAAGSCFVLAPGASARAGHDPADPLTVFACHFDLAGRGGGSRLPPTNERLFSSDRIFLEQLARRAMRGWRLDAHDQAGRAELALWQMLLALAPEPEHLPRIDPRIERCVEFIEREPGGRWTIAGLARIAGMSSTHFARLFTTAIGHPPLRHVIQARISRAQTLLDESHLTVAEIADALGYRDVFFFTRQFRQFVGLPPAQYRQSRKP